MEQLIPTDSTVDVTLKVDTSEQMVLEVHFPATDTSVEKPLDTSKKQSIEDAEKEITKGIAEAQRSISRLNNSGISTNDVEVDLGNVKDEAANSSEKKMVLQHLKEVLRKIEDLDESTEWQRLEQELREEFERLEKAQNDLGNDKTGQLVNQLRSQTDQVIRSKDVRMGREVLDQINSLFIHLTMVYQCMGFIQDCHRRFTSICWKDSSRARHLVSKGMEEINTQPAVEKLLPIARQIIELMPDGDKPNNSNLLSNGE